MPTTAFAISLTIISTLFGALGGFLFKKASQNLKVHPKDLIQNYKLFFGFFFFGLAGVLYIIALTQGELNVLYPISSLTYVWSLFIANKYLKEKITSFKWAGMILILFGAVLITR